MTEGVSQRILIGIASVVVIVAGMKLAAGIIVPFILAVFIAILASPAVYWMNRRGAPTWLAVILVILLTGGALMGVSAVLVQSFGEIRQDLPEYQRKFDEQYAKIVEVAGSRGIEVPEGIGFNLIDAETATTLIAEGFESATALLANGVLILLMVVFILLEASDFPDKVRAVSKRPDQSLGDLDFLARQVFRYFFIKTLTSLGTGLIIYFWLLFFNIDYALLLGLLAFLLNYIPNIGSLIAAIPGVLLAFITQDIGTAIWAGVGYLAVNNVIGNLVEPRVMGEGLGLSTLVVFLSLVFWGWVLGPIGMLLSAPLTMAVKIALQANEDTRPLALMLGSGKYVRQMAAQQESGAVKKSVEDDNTE